MGCHDIRHSGGIVYVHLAAVGFNIEPFHLRTCPTDAGEAGLWIISTNSVSDPNFLKPTITSVQVRLQAATIVVPFRYGNDV